MVGVAMLIFTDFLKQQGVDLELFEKNCLHKYRRWESSVHPEIDLDEPATWISNAFAWNYSLQQDIDWFSISRLWHKHCRETPKSQIIYIKSHSPEW
jgi:hypothetical protein